MEFTSEQEAKKIRQRRHIVMAILAVLLMVGISVAAALIVHNMDKSVPASADVKDGLSAYELAVKNGYKGTVQEWLESLSGKSAYEIAVENGYEGTEDQWLEAIEENIFDIAGIRVICSFVQDIYVLANSLLQQDDIKLVKVKDYIQHPKSSGYRSLHLIVEVPIFLLNQKHFVKVEIQLRTIAMDFWASLEHQLRYKKDFDFIF